MTEFLEVASSDEFNINLSDQQPNSSNMNVLDLGLFRAIQSFQYQEAPSTVRWFSQCNRKSFSWFAITKPKSWFLNFATMHEVIKDFGGNNYKLPHMGKEKLEKSGTLSLQLGCDRDTVEKAILHLQ